MLWSLSEPLCEIFIDPLKKQIVTMALVTNRAVITLTMSWGEPSIELEEDFPLIQIP